MSDWIGALVEKDSLSIVMKDKGYQGVFTAKENIGKLEETEW